LWYLYQEIKQESPTPLENELIIQFRNIWDDDLKKAAINQVRALSKFDLVKTLWDVVDITVSEKEREAQMTEYMDKIRKRPKSK